MNGFRLFAALLFATFILDGCDTSSGLFSEAERQSIYSVAFSQSRVRFLSGAAAKPGDEFAVELNVIRGASEPSAFRVDLVDVNDLVIATRTWDTGAQAESKAYASSSDSQVSTTDASGASTIPGFSGANGTKVGQRLLVEHLSGKLEHLALPGDLSPGVYRLVSTLYDQDGIEAQRGSMFFFIGDPRLEIEGLSLYPPTPKPGSAVLLSVSLPSVAAVSRSGSEAIVADKEEAATASAAVTDSWIRWSCDGILITEGSWSKGFDRVVWSAPRIEGAYPIRVEVFPVAPPHGVVYTEPSPWRYEMKAIVRGAAIVDEFADSAAFVSRFAFEGNFEDYGTRVVSDQAKPVGDPKLDVYTNGFGYRFDENAGLGASGALPPLNESGEPLPFSVLWRFYAEPPSLVGEAKIASFVDAEGLDVLTVGFDDGRPFVELAGNGSKSRSRADFYVPAGRIDLALSFDVDAGKSLLAPVWTLDGIPWPSPALPLVSFSAMRTLHLGGLGSLAAVYDEFAIRDDSVTGPPELFRAASARRHGSSLYFVEGFESGKGPREATITGRATPRERSLSLAPGARMDFGRRMALDRPWLFELHYEGLPEALRLDFGQEGGLALFSVSGTGDVLGADGSVIGRLPLLQTGRIVFSTRPVNGLLEISAEVGNPITLKSVKAVSSASFSIRAVDLAKPADPMGSVNSTNLVENRKSVDSVEIKRLLVVATPERLVADTKTSIKP